MTKPTTDAQLAIASVLNDAGKVLGMMLHPVAGKVARHFRVPELILG